MAKVFLDTNALIDFVEQRANFDETQLSGHELFISPLSIHILSYLYKYSVPEKKLGNINEIFNLIPLDTPITTKSLSGPTKDFEDNVQLHSASETECDIFLTSDRKLLDLKFFGKMQIIKKLQYPLTPGK